MSGAGPGTAQPQRLSKDDDGSAMCRLDQFLRERLADLPGEISVEKVAGGQSNPTFFVSYGPERLVLRKQPEGELLPSAHAIDREYRVMSALRSSPVPVPEVIVYCADAAVIGTPFYVMRRVEGRVLHGGLLAGVTPAERAAMYRSLAETLADLHRLDPAERRLDTFGRPAGYFERQISRWTRQRELSKARPDPNINRLIDWLPRNIPAGSRSTIVHGDYRLGNVMFHPVEPRIVAVMDWELSTLGHPMSDLAHCCMLWHTTAAEYGGVEGAALAELGLPEQVEFERWYYDRAGHEERLQPFHMAFALFRFAVIFDGIAARARHGNAADDKAADVGRLAASFAARAARMIDA